MWLFVLFSCNDDKRDPTGDEQQPAGPTTPEGGCDERCDALADTVRFARLTHLQWESTVQDLLHLDAPTGLSDSFLGDTLSEGFDNDADNLEIGPDLWVDYQRAAEALAAQVVSSADRYNLVVPEDPRSGQGGPSFTERVEAEDPDVDATTGGSAGSSYNLWSQGSLTYSLTLPEDGSYVFSARVWADQAGGELARASLSFDNTVVFSGDVTASSEGTAETLSAEIDTTGGFHTLEVSFLNDYYESGQDRNLYVDWMEISGATSGLGPSSAGDAERDAWIASFGKRAHRRPLTEGEIALYTALFDSAPEIVGSGDDFADGVELVLSAMLQSPYFLYRIEESETAGPDGAIPLSDYEIASKLSYALWNTMPDDALFVEADAGRLSTSEGLQSTVERLLDDERAQATLEDLHRQLLLLDNYANIYKDPDLYPEFGPTTAASMRAEALAFTDAIFAEGGSINDLFTSTRTYVNADLAPIYGLSGPYGDELVPVDLDPGQRAGLLTLSGFLALEADGYVSSPIRRGVFVNLHVLCAPLPPPPNVIPPLPANEGDLTTRELVDLHTGEGTCGEGCHSAMINPPGFALENFDALGRWRDTEFGLPIDAAASYTLSSGEASWEDPISFAAIIGDAFETHRCYNEHLLQYLHGRASQATDDALLDWLATRSRTDDKPIRELITELVLTNSFRSRTDQVQP